MFDKYKARFAKFEEDHESVRKVTKHIEKHQVLYASGATGVLCIFGTRTFAKPTVVNNIIEQAAPVISPVFNNHNIGNVVNNVVNNGGYTRKIVRCIETDEMWPSMTKAASSAGHTLQAMSKHIHGQNEHLDGLHYVIEGITAN
jgi:hypothetical protein